MSCGIHQNQMKLNRMKNLDDEKKLDLYIQYMNQLNKLDAEK